jgi:hypothetical protein
VKSTLTDWEPVLMVEVKVAGGLWARAVESNVAHATAIPNPIRRMDEQPDRAIEWGGELDF